MKHIKVVKRKCVNKAIARDPIQTPGGEAAADANHEMLDNVSEMAVKTPKKVKDQQKLKAAKKAKGDKQKRLFNSPKRLFWRAFASTLGVLFCSFAVVIGILVADARTHNTAEAEEYRSFLLEANGDTLSITFLGSKMSLDLEPLRQAAAAVEPLQELSPPEYRLVSTGFERFCDWLCNWITSL